MNIKLDCTILSCFLSTTFTLYMTRATTRVKSLGLKQGLKILIVDGDGENTDTISNVVYHEVFRNVS